MAVCDSEIRIHTPGGPLRKVREYRSAGEQLTKTTSYLTAKPAPTYLFNVLLVPWPASLLVSASRLKSRRSTPEAVLFVFPFSQVTPDVTDRLGGGGFSKQTIRRRLCQLFVT